ncbi:MAG TPA: sigma-54-dependent Fis family transcriptional regulator [Lacipirellulaceae bacterium]|nr:sigma-54-dependent Fis family transcriptional regulator [Lacipirellulaceae bacterium]
MPDIVANLLRLSSELTRVGDLLEPALDLVVSATNSEAAAVARAEVPKWTVVAARGVAQSAIPLELAAEALEQSGVVARDGWFASPVVGAARGGAAVDREYVVLVRGKCSESQLAAVSNRLSDAIAVVERTERALARVDRIEAILRITNQWHQTNDMETLLVRMAEAATRLLNADRSSIFLWDKPNKTIVGRPALGIEKGELRLPDDAGIVGQVIQTGEARRVNSEFDDEIDRDVDRQTGYRTKTIVCVPLVSPDGSRMGAFEVLNKRNGVFTADDQRGLTELASYAAVALENTQQFEELLERQEKLVEQAAQDATLVGESSAIQAVRATARRVADTDLAVLILGENGTGKEVVSRLIHFGSRRRKHPFLAVNCAAITETLLESELFGHEKGAFTDAHEARAGKFELAAGGTLLLDEIGDMSLSGQAKLLRVLEDKTIVRVGGSRPIFTDVRVLAATNQKLAELVRAKRFREDLYFRLNVVTLELPPLRERSDDTMLLAEHFLREFSKRAGRRPPKFTAAARKRLESHLWPGNVRELRNLMERLAYLTSDDRIEVEDLAFILSPGAGTQAAIGAGLTLNDATHEFQRRHIQQAIDAARGNVSQAAKNLGVHRSNLYRKMRQLGMEVAEE